MLPRIKYLDAASILAAQKEVRWSLLWLLSPRRRSTTDTLQSAGHPLQDSRPLPIAYRTSWTRLLPQCTTRVDDRPKPSARIEGVGLDARNGRAVGYLCPSAQLLQR